MGINDNLWMTAVTETVTSYRRMIDAAVGQLSDTELRKRPADGVNSVAHILRHLGGNLRSRWTDFFLTDGEKPDRNRDMEFVDWDGDRESLIQYFDSGWSALTSTIQEFRPADLSRQVLIRGEPHTVPLALIRTLTHLAGHVGQIVMISRMVHEGEWNWLSIRPGDSTGHNERTWGSASSRSVFGDPEIGRPSDGKSGKSREPG